MFHFYSEELSFNAKYNHNIDTLDLPINSFHKSEGGNDGSFSKSLNYLRKKYKNKRLVGTCFNAD